MSKSKSSGKFFQVLQMVGRSFFLPVSVLPAAGILLGLGASFTNPTTIASIGAESLLGAGTVLNQLLSIMSAVGGAVFGNLPLIFAMAVALGMAKQEKAVAVLSSAISFILMHVTINQLLNFTGKIVDGAPAEGVLSGTIATTLGIQTLEMGVFGGILVGLVTAALHNRFYKTKLPNALSFYEGTRFVPIVCMFAHLLVGIVAFFVWPFIQQGIYAIGSLVLNSGYFGTFIFGFTERALIPFGLHHVFYIPFWQTGLGGTMEVAGEMVEGAQNIFFAQLADPNTTKFSVEATRFMTGKYGVMMGGLLGAAYAMYKTAKPENKKVVGGLLFSAAFTSFLTGITEPIEFTFLFVAPALYIVHSIFAGISFVLMHLFNITVGTTFSCGLIDMTLYGVLQGNAKTNWLLLIPIYVVFFFVYYFLFAWAIKKWNLMTPGREEIGADIKLHTKDEYRKSKGMDEANIMDEFDEKSVLILEGLGGLDNVVSIDACATRLRVELKDSDEVNEGLLKQTGSIGLIKKGVGVQVIYGPQVTNIKSNLVEYVDALKAKTK